MTYGRHNPRITFDQYLKLVEVKRSRERGMFQRLVREWGVPQSTVSTAVRRGIKMYEYRIWKSQTGAQPW